MHLAVGGQAENLTCRGRRALQPQTWSRRTDQRRSRGRGRATQWRSRTALSGRYKGRDLTYRLSTRSGCTRTFSISTANLPPDRRGILRRRLIDTYWTLGRISMRRQPVTAFAQVARAAFPADRRAVARAVCVARVTGRARELSSGSRSPPGALGRYQKVRNRNTLTVVMFHRVLATDDERWAHADPRYTMTEDPLEQCIEGSSASTTRSVDALAAVKARGETGRRLSPAKPCSRDLRRRLGREHRGSTRFRSIRRRPSVRPRSLSEVSLSVGVSHGFWPRRESSGPGGAAQAPAPSTLPGEHAGIDADPPRELAGQ